MFLAGLCLSLASAVRSAKLRIWAAGVVLVELAVISALFLYWANRITGDMYSFNGYFYYSIHLLGLFLVAGTISAWLADRMPALGRWALLLWLAPFVGMVAVAADFRNSDSDSNVVRKISSELQSRDKYHRDTYQLVFQHDDWDTAVGVANQMGR